MATPRVTFGKTTRTKRIHGLTHSFWSDTEVRVDGKRVGALTGSSEITTVVSGPSVEIQGYSLHLDDPQQLQAGGIYTTFEKAKTGVRTALNKKLRDGWLKDG